MKDQYSSIAKNDSWCKEVAKIVVDVGEFEDTKEIKNNQERKGKIIATVGIAKINEFFVFLLL